MSVFTSVLNLFQYDPVADKKSTYNIQQALNDNWDKIDAAIGEDRASLSKKADWNDGFIQAGSIKVWAEAKTINTGIATSPDTTDVPYASFWMVNVYIYPAGGWKLLTATCVINGEQFYAIKNASLPWSDWFKVLTTATPITEHDFPLTSGFTKNGDCVFFKTQDGIVHCVGSVGGNFIQAENHFATLPSGFRPKAIFALPGTGRDAGCSACVTIRPEGGVTFWPEKVCQAAYFSFTFVADTDA